MDGQPELGGSGVAEDLVHNSFLFIGELARKTGSDPKTIRFYERADLLSPPRHGRFRTYLASDVRRLKNVLLLRKMGVPIAQIRELFAAVGADSDILSDAKAVDMLRTHLETLKSRQDEINLQVQQTSVALAKLVA
jgi:DNA-binding transcriptional MerR regulator